MQIIKCKVCKETISHHKLLIKKYPDYHCKPVNSSGNIKSKIALIGLAPGLHGANKTGVPFTSDFSGVVIRKILDKLYLQDIFITNVVRCYPKNNKPSSSIIINISPSCVILLEIYYIILKNDQQFVKNFLLPK